MARKITRREMLQHAAALGGAAGLPARSLAQATGISEPYDNLSAGESRTLEAIIARLIPADENGPGALEAGAAHYIDRSLTSALASSLDAYRAGLAAVDAHARGVGARAFAELEPAQQDRVLDDLERNVATGFEPDAATFFELVRNHTIEGTFCDPSYGGNRDFLGWELIGYPGIRLAVGSDEQRMSAELALNRVSAYDFPMFDAGAIDDAPDRNAPDRNAPDRGAPDRGASGRGAPPPATDAHGTVEDGRRDR